MYIINLIQNSAGAEVKRVWPTIHPRIHEEINTEHTLTRLPGTSSAITCSEEHSTEKASVFRADRQNFQLRYCSKHSSCWSDQVKSLNKVGAQSYISLVWAPVAIPRVGSHRGRHKWLSLFWGQLLPSFLRSSIKTAEAVQSFPPGAQWAGLTIWGHLCSALRSLESSRT